MIPKNKVVIGLGFGDEGKGITTSYLCSKSNSPLVIRYSGGHQAGHTDVYNGKRHVFSNFGAGTLRGIPTYYSNHCTIDPIGIINEYEMLLEKKIEPMLYIDPMAMVTTPYDMAFNQMSNRYIENGTVGVGYGSTIQRNEHYYHLYFRDLYYPIVMHAKLANIAKYYSVDVKELNLTRFFDCVKRITNRLVGEITCATFHDAISGYCDLIFEGAQGILLDQHFGFFPNVTRSNTGIKNVHDLVNKIDMIYLVTRAYQTRHGNGFMSNKSRIVPLKNNENETNVNGDYQGDFRVSVLDLDLLNYGIECNNIRKYNLTLIVTCLDQVDGLYQLTSNGRDFATFSKLEFVNTISSLLDIHNVIISESDQSDNLYELILKP